MLWKEVTLVPIDLPPHYDPAIFEEQPEQPERMDAETLRQICDGPKSSMKSINLVVRNLGHVPSFKNNKMLCRGRLITDPKKQKWMEACIQSILSQLTSFTTICDGETWTAQSQPFLIASLLPEDDSLHYIREIVVRAVRVPKGMEGARIKVESRDMRA